MAKILIRIEIGGQTRVLTWSFCCTILIAFANGGLRVSFNSRRWPQSCYSELRILIGRRHVAPEFWFASNFSGQTRVLTWSFCCTILIPVQMDALSSSFKSLGDPKTCHSELRVFYCICGTESSWPKASRYHCIPYVMGGGWELFIHIRLVTATAEHIVTLLTLLKLSESTWLYYITLY